MNEYALHTDFCMYTTYVKCAYCASFWVCGWWCASSDDQRDGWSTYKNLVIGFDHTWINGTLDWGEYNDLLGHAKNKGLGVWFYQLQDGENEALYLLAFSEQAWFQGWSDLIGSQYIRDKYVNGIPQERLFLGPICYDPPSQCDFNDVIQSVTLSDEIFYMEKVVDYYSYRDLTSENFVIPNNPDRNKCAFIAREHWYNVLDPPFSKITLKPGFHAVNGSEFNASIDQQGLYDNLQQEPMIEGLSKTNYESTPISTLNDILPKDYNISQNYPNPFNPSTIINYQLPKDSRVILEVYNVLGEKITTLVDELITAGYHQVNFNGNHLPSGLYIYRINAVSLETGEVFDRSTKMMLVK